VNLGYNQLDTLPDVICLLKTLTELNLDGNQLTTLAAGIGRLRELNVLTVSMNQLTELSPRIGQLTKLISLNLDDNRLRSLPPEIGRLKALTSLSLICNELTALPSEIGQLTALKTLSLGTNSRTMATTNQNKLAILPPEIGQLTSLTSLDLCAIHLTSLPSEIGRLAALTSLNLAVNMLTSLPPEIGGLTALTLLDLTQNSLLALPPEIGRLTRLTSLHLRNNELTTLPGEIGKLTEVTSLDLTFNQLETLPAEIGQMKSLAILNLGQNYTVATSGGNRISTLPPEIAELPVLAHLFLASIGLTRLPSGIGKLISLTTLNLQSNQLTDLPPEIGKLRALDTLNLGSNQLTALPSEIGDLAELKLLDLTGNQLTSLPDSLRGLPKLERLFLHDNPALRLSPAILGNPWYYGDRAASAKPILDFYFGRLSGAARPLNEVKLILVGRGGAGKTSTVRALTGESFQDGEESTSGIALCDWWMDECAGEPVLAHVWDFAGQVITHALHQFFFSVRSVYVVVLTGRENNERDDAEYWLRLIKAFGTDDKGQGPPVIVALNKWDVPGCRPRVDRGALQERYPFIRDFVEMDCKSKKGIEKLKAVLTEEVDRLPWVREPFPETWNSVRLALTDSESTRAHLTYSEFRQLCVDHEVKDEGQQDSLSEILHNLGTALNYRNDPRLREATVLQPDWLTGNVYALMRHAESQEGVLKQSDVDEVLCQETNPEMREYLVRIMERFEIAYAPRVTSAGVWLVPQALPDEQPPSVAAFRDLTDATRLRYTYQALPEGLVARAIVRLHEFIEEADGRKQQWGSGAILTREGARALIRTEPHDRQVMVTVTGPTKSRQQLAGLCQDEMRDIHREIRGLDPTEETQVKGSWVATATLEGDEKRGQATGISTNQGTVLIDPTESINAYSERLARSDDVWKPTAFISYSKSNVPQRKRLESELKILKNEGLLAGHWQDRMIDPGDSWHETIQSELAKADVVILLASVAALATDYIVEHEIPKALELHEAAKTVVVPVILEKCRWDKTPLRPLNALPEKAKPLNNWTPRSDGWNSIAEGLARVFKKLMAEGKTQKRGSSRASV
jgi:internalin A